MTECKRCGALIERAWDADYATYRGSEPVVVEGWSESNGVILCPDGHRHAPLIFTEAAMVSSLRQMEADLR